MKSAIKGILTIIIMLSCFNVLSNNVFAAGPRDGEIVDGSLLTSDKTATDSFSVLKKAAILSNGRSSITNYGQGVLYMSGETFGFYVCDEMRAHIILERLVDNEWEYVTQRYYTGNDVYTVSDGVYLTLFTKTYYRVRGTHTAIKDNMTETQTTLTNGIYIG